ncbi:Sugar phosphate transporter domain [Trinorchestia longiramus]|nr:Sugar phosphate transporter domain [Trinorchestia longiramus]
MSFCVPGNPCVGSVPEVWKRSFFCFMTAMLRLLGISTRQSVLDDYFWTYVIPLALGKFFSSVFSHVSLWKVPVSYAHTVKGSMPLFTVIWCRVIFQEKHSKWIYASLVPIILGVAIASITELSFDVMGLATALVATCGFSLQNIFSKKVIVATKVSNVFLLYKLGSLSFMMFIPVWLAFDGRIMLYDTQLVVRRSGQDTIFLLIADGMLNWLQNLVAFSIMSKVSPLTYSVASATKRVVIISSSLLILANPVTPSNVFGMVLAALGVISYNKAKHMRDRKKLSLPSTTQDTNGLMVPLMHQIHPAYPFDYNRSRQVPSLLWPTMSAPLHPTDLGSELKAGVSAAPAPYLRNGHSTQSNGVVMSDSHHGVPAAGPRSGMAGDSSYGTTASDSNYGTEDNRYGTEDNRYGTAAGDNRYRGAAGYSRSAVNDINSSNVTDNYKYNLVGQNSMNATAEHMTQQYAVQDFDKAYEQNVPALSGNFGSTPNHNFPLHYTYGSSSERIT